MNRETHTLSSADISIFFTGNQQILLYQETQMQILFSFIIYNSFNLFGFKITLINMATILVTSAKMATLGLLKIKVFWNKCYDFIISAYGVINKIFSRDLNSTVNVGVWPKFGNSSISMREVILTSIL